MAGGGGGIDPGSSGVLAAGGASQASIGVDGSTPYVGQFDESTLIGWLFGQHQVVNILFVIPEAVGSINTSNAAILVELQKHGHVDTIVQGDAVNFPDFAQYNFVVCGSDISSAWVLSNLDHVREFPESVLCVDEGVAGHFLMGVVGGDAAAVTAMVAIPQIEANDLGIGHGPDVGLVAGANTIAASTIFNTIDMSDADITETFFGTESSADNTDVLLACIFKRQPDGTRGINSDGFEVPGTRWFYGPAFSAVDLNTLGMAVLGLIAHMAIQASTEVGFEVSGDIGDLETKIFGNQANEFNNGNPLVEYLTGRNSSGTRLAIGKSLYDIIGAAYVDGGGGFGTDSLLADLRILLDRQLGDGASAVENSILGKRVTRAAADVFDGTQTALYTVAGGRVMVTHLEVEVTVAGFDAGASLARFLTNPTIGTDQNMCADLDVDGDELGSIYAITGLATDPLVGGSGGGAAGMDRRFVVPEGTIDLISSADAAAVSGSQGKFEIWYIPLDDGATIVAA